jgi:transglutaminase-like putative cysteine protease
MNSSSFSHLMKFSIAVIFLLAMTSAWAITPIEAGSMDARVLITNSAIFEQTGPRYSMEEATGTLTWFPREDESQQVLSLRSDPSAKQTDEAFIFHWENPQPVENIEISGVIRTHNHIIPVRDSIPFPLQQISPEAAAYLESGEITDQNPKIQALAQELAAGKTDAYEVVYTLADWTTRNVEYSLASVGQPAIQRSSEVLSSREGKCDELTALFISMNRALGIPARFVAGYAYTNSHLFDQPWGGHGWAEVWLPGQGWVPFDVTYGEYGYLDAGHIKLKHAPDAKETSIDYSARGSDFRLQTQPLSISITPINLQEQHNTDISITLDAPHKTVGFGSAALILATVKNNQDYYVSTRLDLAKTSNTDVLSKTYENILLKPHEVKTIPILVHMDEELKSGFIYEFPFKLHSRLGPSSSITLRVEENAPIYDKSAFAQYFISTSTTKPATSITCDRGNSAYVNEVVSHECVAEGKLPVEICGDTCFIVTEKMFTIETIDKKPGIFTRTYRAGDARFFVTSRTVLPTKLAITFEGPEEIVPDDLVILTLNLSSSGALPKNINVTMQAHHAKAVQHLSDLQRPASLIFTVPGRALRPGDNNVTATLHFNDELGGTHTEQVETHITLVDATFGDRIQFWLQDASQAIIDLFS